MALAVFGLCRAPRLRRAILRKWQRYNDGHPYVGTWMFIPILVREMAMVSLECEMHNTRA